MAQLAPIATLAATGISLYAADQQNRQQKKAATVQRQNFEIQEQNRQAAEAQQQRLLAVQASADQQARQRHLARTLATARARLGAGGVSPTDGSAAALQAGLRAEAERSQGLDDKVYATRLATGRRSLLRPDGSVQPPLMAYARAGMSFGNALRSLLD